MIHKVFDELRLNGDVVIVKRSHHLRDIDGIIIPGDESTTIGRLAKRFDALDIIRDLVVNGTPVFGTCAGAMMTEKVKNSVVSEVQQSLLGVMNIEV